MPIAVNCSQCGRSYQLRDELAGKKAKCKCGGTILIPAAPAAPLAPDGRSGSAFLAARRVAAAA